MAGGLGLAAAWVGWLVSHHGHPAGGVRPHRFPSTQLPVAIQVVVPVLAALTGAWLVFVICGLIKTAHAPVAQRNEARDRLGTVRFAVNRPSIVPQSLRVQGGPNIFYAVCAVRNSGPSGEFEVTIDSIEDASPPLGDPFVHLLWWDRREVVVEEIPSTGVRPIAFVAIQRPTTGGLFQVHSLSPVGVLRDPPSVADTNFLTVWFRVSLRNQPLISYVRRIGVRVEWPAKTDKPILNFAPDPPDVEIRRSDPSFEDLLDFDPQP